MEKEKTEIKQFFMASEQLHGDMPHKVKTPDGWRAFSEQASKGIYPNGVNNFGAKAFFESENPEIEYAKRTTKLGKMAGTRVPPMMTFQKNRGK